MLTDCQILELGEVINPHGILAPVESFRDAPFQLERVCLIDYVFSSNFIDRELLIVGTQN